MSEDRTVTAIGATQRRVSLPEIGQQIGRYTVLGELGAGAMGTVFLASDPQLDRRIAVKLLTRSANDSRLLDEARALARLQHPNVVAVHDVGQWQDRVYVAMEYIEGESLQTWLESHGNVHERLAAFVQAANGLAAAHKAGVVHHDVKPTNIMVGNDGRVRLVDFGLARSAAELTQSSPAGTPRYMAPEQHLGSSGDARSDQYALCVAMYESLFATHPFPTREAALEGRVDVPTSHDIPLATIDGIVRGLASDPAQRHPNMEGLIRTLQPAVPQRSRGRFVALAVLGVAVGGGAMFYAKRDRTPDDPRAAILAASHLPEELRTPIPGDPDQLTIHRLSNGLTVYISPNHDRPRVSAIWRFHGGDGDAPGVATLAFAMSQVGTEKVGTTDYAKERPHLEHIAALYTMRRLATDAAVQARIDAMIDAESTAASAFELPDEHGHTITELGGTIEDSGTSLDQQSEYQTLASNRLDAWAELEADRWTHPVTRLFRATVAGQLKALARDHDLAFSDAVNAGLYAGDGLAAAVKQRSPAIAREPYEEIEHFARTHFIPNNADLFLAGDLDPITAIPLLEHAFASWQPRLPPELVVASSPSAARSIPIATEGRRGTIYAWARPEHFDPARFALLAELVGQLRRAEGVPPIVTSGARLNRIFLVELVVGSTATKTLDPIIDRIRSGDFSDEALAGVKHTLRVNALQLIRDNSLRNFRVRTSVENKWRGDPAMHLDTIDRADVMRTAREMFGGPQLTLALEPGAAAPVAPAGPAAPPGNFPPPRDASELVARAHSPIEPKFLLAGRDFFKRDTPAGHLIVARDRTSKVFELRVRYEVGSYDLPALCVAMQSNPNNETLQTFASQHALSGNAACEYDHSNVIVWGADEDFPAARGFIDGILGDPTPAGWANAQRGVERWIERVRTSPAGSMPLLWAFARNGFRAPELASSNFPAVHGSTLADGQRALEALRRSDRTIVYYGPRSVEEVAALLPPIVVTREPPKPWPAMLAAPNVVAVDTHSNELRIDIQFDVDESEAQRVAADLWAQYWSVKPFTIANKGSGSASLTLERSSGRHPTVSYVLRIRTDAAHGAAAIADTLADVFEAPLEARVLERARTRLDNDQRSNWLSLHDQSPGADILTALIDWNERHLASDPRMSYFEELAQLDVAAIDSLRTRVRTQPRRIAIAGDLAGLDRAALATYGPITELTGDQLVAPPPVRAVEPKRKPRKKRR